MLEVLARSCQNDNSCSFLHFSLYPSLLPSRHTWNVLYSWLAFNLLWNQQWLWTCRPSAPSPEIINMHHQIQFPQYRGLAGNHYQLSSSHSPQTSNYEFLVLPPIAWTESSTPPRFYSLFTDESFRSKQEPILPKYKQTWLQSNIIFFS